MKNTGSIAVNTNETLSDSGAMGSYSGGSPGSAGGGMPSAAPVPTALSAVPEWFGLRFGEVVKQKRWLYLITFFGVVGLGVLSTGIQMLGMLVVFPMSTLVGFVGIAFYLAVVTVALFRFPGFRWKVSALAVLWGGGASVLLAFTFTDNLEAWLRHYHLDALVYSLTGAWPEELAKGLGIVLLFLLFADRPWHGLIIGAFVGLGFEVVENLMYGTTLGMLDPNSDVDGAIQSWLMRGIAGPMLHVVFCSFVGLGIGEMFTGRLWGTAWVLVGFFAHFGWNLQLDILGGLVGILVTGAIAYPLFVVVLVQQWRRGNRDVRYDTPPVTNVVSVKVE